MLRLFIILLLLFFTTTFQAQTSKRELFYRAQLNVEQEDFLEAEMLYDSILNIDSLDCKIYNSYSELLITAKKFLKAKLILEKLQKFDEKLIYEPQTSLNLGIVNKQLGQYESALNNFKYVISFDKKEKYAQLNAKANREVESCNWAIENKKDTLKYTINKLHGIASSDSEFGHAVMGSSLIVSSLKCNTCKDSTGVAAESYLNKIYTVKKENGSQLKEITSLNSTFNHTSNGTFSSDHQKFYFSSCNTNPTNKNCKILVSNYKKGVWSKPDTLIGEINTKNFSFTMPAFGTINGSDYLFFCSDMKNGLGGLDIYYGVISDNFIDQVKPVQYINSVENEIAPFFDSKNETLYFSTTWLNGFGGYDIHKTKFKPEKESEIFNLGIPFNSSNNDTYIIKDSSNFYVTSNRNHTSENKTCCTDIYLLKPIPKIIIDTVPKLSKTDSLKLISENLRRLEKQKNIEHLQQLIPVSLYFHNDIPNPKTKDSLTRVNYLETYDEYNQMLSMYKLNYSNGLIGHKKIEAQNEITIFYTNYLQQGKKDLDDFLQLLEIELANGASFELIFKGYASPLAQTDYNKLLSKRRISSVKNYIAFYKNGVLLKYLIPQPNKTAKLIFKEEPFGEYKSDVMVSDNPNDLRNSVYSKKAALERKVEIIGFRVL